MKRIEEDVQRLNDQVEQQAMELVALKRALIALKAEFLALLEALAPS